MRILPIAMIVVLVRKLKQRPCPQCLGSGFTGSTGADLAICTCPIGMEIATDPWSNEPRHRAA